MDFLEAMVYLLVLYIAVLIPLAWLLWEYVRPWAKELWLDLSIMRRYRAKRKAALRRERARMEVYQEMAQRSMRMDEMPILIYKEKGEK